MKKKIFKVTVKFVDDGFPFVKSCKIIAEEEKEAADLVRLYTKSDRKFIIHKVVEMSPLEALQEPGKWYELVEEDVEGKGPLKEKKLKDSKRKIEKAFRDKVIEMNKDRDNGKAKEEKII